jgi:hypothetical protein
MSIKESIAEAIGNLDEAELRQVADYLAFLRFRARARRVAIPDASQTVEGYAEFADEDRNLAEEGMAEYGEHLRAEDAE